MARWARRNRVVAVTVVMALAIAGGIGTLVWQAPASADPDPWHLIATADPDPTADPGTDRFHAGWVGLSQIDGGERPVSYRRSEDGSVRLRGLAFATGVPAPEIELGSQPSASVFTLPCGYRPAKTTRLSVAVATLQPDGMGTDSVQSGIVNVLPDGRVLVTASALVFDNGGEPYMKGGVLFDVTIDADQGEFGNECDTAPPRALYVATDGDDANPGTIEEPLATLAKAIEYVRAGDQIIIRGGTYPTEQIYVNKSGTDGAPIDILAYPGEQPVLDGAPMGPRVDENDFRTVLNLQDVSWLNVSGLEVTGGPFGAIQCTNCNETNWTGLRVHDNYGTGMQIIDHDNGDSSGNNTIVDSDFYRNHDQVGLGEGGDGLDLWNLNGTGNRLIRNRYWDNTDDGLDLFDTETSVYIEENWAWGNGVDDHGDFSWSAVDGYDPALFEGDGFGFKLGGDGVGSPQDNPHRTWPT